MGNLLNEFKKSSLKEGFVTQNGTWISYKTKWYGESLALYQKLAEELADFLAEKGIDHNSDFEASHATNSSSRLHCVTVRVTSNSEKISQLIYNGDAIN